MYFLCLFVASDKSTLNVRGFVASTGKIDPTPTNLASETGNPTGFGAVTAARRADDLRA